MPNLHRLLYLVTSACGALEMPSNQPDAGLSHADASACVAETDAQFCARLGDTCEDATALDNCGATRTASCGICGGTDVCAANVCKAPVCSTFAFPTKTLVTALDDTQQQDAIAGVSADGKTVLAQRRPCGNPFQLLLADNNGLALVVTDISANAALAAMLITQEGTLALTADGLTIIGTSTDGTKLLASSRPAAGSTAFAAASNTDFAALNVTAPRRIDEPVISADGLEVFYRITSDPDPALNGLYESVRAAKTSPFPAGAKMSALVNTYGAVTGISSDRMTLFLQTNAFSEVVLTRRSVKDPFTNPNLTAPPPTVPGFRTRPLGDCNSLVATYTPGGCNSEETAIYTK